MFIQILLLINDTSDQLLSNEVGIFYAKFLLDRFDSSSDFSGPACFVLRDLKLSLIHNCKKLNTSDGSSP